MRGEQAFPERARGGRTDLSGIETSMESLAALWVDVGVIDIDINDRAYRDRGRLFGLDRTFFRSCHYERRGGQGDWSRLDGLIVYIRR